MKKEEKNKVKYKENIGFKDMLSLYVIALMDVAKNGEDNLDYSISLYPSSKKPHVYRDFKVTKNEAEQLIKNIYKLYFDYSNNRYFSADFMEENENGDSLIPEELYDMVKKLNENSNWKYFRENRMFDIYKELGYTDADYLDLIKKQMDLMKPLIKCIKQGGEQDGE